MFAYKDFNPAVVTKGGSWRSHKVGPLDDVVVEARQWATEKAIEVISIETILLPLTARDPRESYGDSALSVELGTAQWTQIIRLWYRSSN